MTYTVTTDVFQGPFDLLLHLVSRQKLDVNKIPLAEIADEYVAHIERMRELDLDVASEFLVVAASLLEMKAAGLLPRDEPFIDEELEDLSPEEARELLITRLLTYKKFKNVAAELSARMESVGRLHPRQAGLEERFLGLMPDYLEGLTLHALATICADLLHRKEVFLLQAEHVASAPISLDEYTRDVEGSLRRTGRVTFGELVGQDATPEEVVVTLLAVLELYKREVAEVRQEENFGEIELTLLSEEARA